MPSEYEALRAGNIARNNARLQQLGLDPDMMKKTKVARKRAARPTNLPKRQSKRARSEPPAVYNPDDASVDRERALESQRQGIANGHRLADGRWRGEQFGEVAGVPVGTVFGRGDYQRKGRTEMTETGFFVPWVQPEFLDKGGAGCYAVVLNNDNGLSDDHGDVVVYAGSGGRRRGQNRSAPQSFDQSWESATNAALQRNFKAGLPVRVVRGPKLAGRHGTASTGGGFRYDGLFSVEAAELQRTEASQLLTCMFTLRRQA